MVRIKFNLRDKTRGKQTPIRVLVRWDGKTLKYSSGYHIDPRDWSVKTQKVVRPYVSDELAIEVEDFNLDLDNLKSSIKKAYNDLWKKLERQPNPNELRDAIDLNLGRVAQPTAPDLLQFIEKFIDDSRTKINPINGKVMAVQSIKNYQTTLTHLREFLKKDRPQFDQIDLNFYDRFNKFLSQKKGLALNSVGKSIQTLKSFLRAAEEEGIEVNPSYRTKRFKTPSELTDKVYLTDNELNALFHLDLSQNKRLETVRDLFLVGAWTGLRFSDFTTIERDHIVDDRIRIRAKKTGSAVVIPLHAIVRAVMSKYSEQFDNSLPPAISNQKMNSYLKEVTALVDELQTPVMVSSTVGGVRKTIAKRKCELVTTHTARRSFATNMYKMGCPTRSIMAITGHKTENSFRAYIRLDSDEHADIIQLIMDKTTTMSIVS
jgi:site-specific recombinase XerD